MSPDIGATALGNGQTRFLVWAPRVQRLAVRVTAPVPRTPVPMTRRSPGWFEATPEDAGPGTRYMYLLDGERERPDPTSRALPEGVHGPSEVVDPTAFPWTDGAWRGMPLPDMVVYEIHVGAFTPEGTFDAVISAYAVDHLDGPGIVRALEEAKRVLRPGGEILLLNMATDAWTRFAYTPLLGLHSSRTSHGSGAGGAHAAMSPEIRWRALLEHSGFEVVEIGHRPGTLFLLARKPGLRTVS